MNTDMLYMVYIYRFTIIITFTYLSEDFEVMRRSIVLFVFLLSLPQILSLSGLSDRVYF